MRTLRSCVPVLILALPALGLAQYKVSFTVNRPDDSNFEITNIFMLERGSYGGGGTWAFQVPYGSTSTTLDDPFDKPGPVDEALLIGIAHDLPGDAPGQKHVVLMMDDTAAQLSNHIAWGTLFRNTDEDQLIADIELGSSGQDWPIIQPGLDGITEFSSGHYDPFGQYVPSDAEAGILGPGGVPRSAWFAVGGSFTVMAFSEGKIVGSGTSQYTAVPEPASFAALGLGLVALRRRRSKR